MCEELKNKIFSFNKYISNQTENEIMQEYWIDIKQVIENQQLKLEKKEKIIDEMAEFIEQHSLLCVENYGANKEEWKHFFERKIK